jgi:choline-phosphate cytidylyltransferase
LISIFSFINLSLKTLYKPAPYSTEPEAIAEREACDYTQKITLEMANNGDCSRKIRIYTEGTFDMLHQGHAKLLMQAKNIFPNSEVYLLVGTQCDEVTFIKKGRTVMTDVERYEAIRHCRYVDEVIRNAPWITTEEFLKENKIDFFAQDATPYPSGDCDDIYKGLKDKGYFVATNRTEGLFIN